MILDSMLYKPCIEYLKKEPYTGSFGNMRYRLCKKVKEIFDGEEKTGEEVYLEVAVYPDDFCFEKTNPELIEYTSYSFDDSGIDLAMSYLDKKQEIY